MLIATIYSGFLEISKLPKIERSNFKVDHHTSYSLQFTVWSIGRLQVFIVSNAVCVLSFRHNLSRQAIIFSTPASVLVPFTFLILKPIRELFLLNLTAAPCFFINIHEGLPNNYSSNQDSYEALFCNDGGALKFAVTILDLYFLCYLVKRNVYLIPYLRVTNSNDTSQQTDPDVELYGQIKQYNYPAYWVSTDVTAQLGLKRN